MFCNATSNSANAARDIVTGLGHQSRFVTIYSAHSLRLLRDDFERRMAGKYSCACRDWLGWMVAKKNACEIGDCATEIQQTGVGGLTGPRLRLSRLWHNRQYRSTVYGIVRTIRVKQDPVVAPGHIRHLLLGRKGRRGLRVRMGEERIDLTFTTKETYNDILLGLELIGNLLEPVFVGNQRSIQFIIRLLKIGHSVFIGGLHLLIAMIFCRDYPVFEDHIHS